MCVRTMYTTCDLTTCFGPSVAKFVEFRRIHFASVEDDRREIDFPLDTNTSSFDTGTGRIMSFLEQIGGSYFENYQENGTKFLRDASRVSFNVLEDLNQCAGEIYLSGIPEYVTAEQVASIICLIGDLYLLRFKVNFAGNARGFAYFQYKDPALMHLALLRLPNLFALNGLGQIRVRQSKNCCKLILKNIHGMNASVVEQTLRRLVSFRHMHSSRPQSGVQDYQIVFGSNEDAVRARRIIAANIFAFGRAANVVWDRADQPIN